MSDDPKLLFCPCCGCAAAFGYESGSWGYYAARHWVTCMGCGLRTGTVSSDETMVGRESVAAVWNARIAEKVNA